ncbi:uncharacterized protein LOC111404860 [Olea europaea var. sylvestris]|uniref:uncharacterized protein LOC111404860 n=1 Tax=Olea europaea var. sylvestris TaxID=158386 RepID=UPI000C1CFCA5|nr:uncharacterized protein LOC111404860 [Olea europaea var. sylvestris]
MAGNEENGAWVAEAAATTEASGKSFGKKCSHVAKKQRAKFYILRRCIAMLVCWHERNDT